MQRVIALSQLCASCALLFFIPPAQANTYFTDEAGSCKIIGDPDVYGIGIRLGYYLQYAATILCLVTNRLDDLKAARSGFNAFSIALLLNLFRSSHQTLAIEWYIVFLLAIVIPASTIPIFKIDRAKSLPALWVHAVIQLAFVLATPYLFFKAVNFGRKEGCSIIAFCFTNIYLYDRGWQITGKVISIFAIPAVLTPQYFLYSEYIRGLRSVSTSDESPQTSQLVFSRQSSKTGIAKGLVFSFPGPFAVAFVESTIVVNHIDMSASPITAAGQLIPLIIGAYILIATVWSVGWEYLERKDNTAAPDLRTAAPRSSLQLRTRNRGHEEGSVATQALTGKVLAKVQGTDGDVHATVVVPLK